MPRVGIDASVSPRMATVNAILRYVRRGRVMTVASLTGIEAEAIEFRVDEGSPAAGKQLKDLHFPKGAVVGTIVRGEEVVVPRGEDRITVGDEVIVFGLPEAIPDIEAMFD